MPSSRETALTFASIGTDDPAVTFRLFRLLAAYCLLGRSLGVVFALLQCDQLREELDRSTAHLEVRAQYGLGLVLRQQISVVL